MYLALCGLVLRIMPVLLSPRSTLNYFLIPLKKFGSEATEAWGHGMTILSIKQEKNLVSDRTFQGSMRELSIVPPGASQLPPSTQEIWAVVANWFSMTFLHQSAILKFSGYTSASSSTRFSLYIYLKSCINIAGPTPWKDEAGGEHWWKASKRVIKHI